MEQLEGMSQYEGAAHWVRDSPAGGPSQGRRRESQKLGALLQRRDSDSDDEPHKLPQAMQVHGRSSVVGEQEFAEKFRSDSSCGVPASFKWESLPGAKALEQAVRSNGPTLLPPRNHGGGSHNSGVLQAPPNSSGHTMLQINAGGSRLPSGLLYPCPNPEGKPNSCLLNAAHFTFDSTILAPDLAGGGGGSNNLTERIFKKLMGQSRLAPRLSGEDSSKSPNSTLDCPTSPASSERSLRGKSSKKSLRCRSEDANTVAAANPRPKSQLAQYLRSMTAMSGDAAASEDDDLEGPSEAAWLDPDSPYHPDRQEVDRYATSTLGHYKYAKKKPEVESWSSSSSSWNLSLVHNPLKTVSTIVGRRHRQRGSTRKSTRFGRDAITHTALVGSYDGSSVARSRAVRKGTGSEAGSGRSWWSEIGSGRKSSSMWACSGRLQPDAADHLHMDHHQQMKNMPVQVDDNNPACAKVDLAQAKVDEAAFPFNNPVASSFVFRETEKSQTSPDAAVPRSGGLDITLHKSAVSVTDSEADLPLSDTYHDPEDGSLTDSDASHTLSLDRDSSAPNHHVLHHHAPQWDSARSLDYVGGVVGLSSRFMSSRAMSGFLEIDRSGRFSVDLNRGQKLDKAQHLPSPDVRLRFFASRKSSRRSILSPCLPFLQRSPHKHAPRIQQAPAVAPTPGIQAVNSFAARLGPVSDNSTIASQPPIQ